MDLTNIPLIRRSRDWASSFLWLISLFALGSLASASPESDRGLMRWERWRSLADNLKTELPQTLASSDLELSLRPKLRDVFSRDVIRLPLKATYGWTDRLELSAELTPYLPNVFKDGTSWGLGQVMMGGKYLLVDDEDRQFRWAAGINMRTPLGNPPDFIIDDYAHIEPYISFSKVFAAWPQYRWFQQISYDFETEALGKASSSEAQQTHLRLNNGVIREGEDYDTFLQLGWEWEESSVDEGSIYKVEPGVIWTPEEPIWRGFPGFWTIRLSYRYENHYLEGSDHGIRLRVSWRWLYRKHSR